MEYVVELDYIIDMERSKYKTIRMEANNELEAEETAKILYCDQGWRILSIMTAEEEEREKQAEEESWKRICAKEEEKKQRKLEKEKEAKQRKLEKEKEEALLLGITLEQYKEFKKNKRDKKLCEKEINRLCTNIKELQKELAYYQAKMAELDKKLNNFSKIY